MFNRLTTLSALVAAITVGSTFSAAVEKQTEANTKKTIVTKVYKVGDLALFMHGQKGWDFSTIVELLEAKIGDDETTSIAPYPQNLSLIVSTTNDKHAIVAKTLREEAAKSKQTEASAKKMIVTRVYNVGDIAAFTQGKNLWHPSILIDLLETKIGNDKTTTIAPYPQNLCLIISTTSDKHDIIVKTIEQHRQKK